MKKILERVIGEIIDSKAHADLILSTSKSFKMSSQNGSISEYKISSSQILGVRVIKDQKVGIAFTESMDEESLSFMIDQALQNAEINEPNSFEMIAEESGEIIDEKSYPEDPIDISIKIKKALELESEVKKRDHRVVAVPHNSYSENEFRSMYLSSRGRFTSYSDKSYAISSSALLSDKDKKANYHDFNLAHRFNDLEWEKVIETSLLHARNILEEKLLPNGKYHVRFDIDALKSLIECFSNLYSARAAMDQLNPWASRIGDPVMSEDLSIEDHPSAVGVFRESLFDDEGIVRRPLVLVKDGILSTLMHNTVTARKYNTTTTGHASRSPSSSLNVSGTHFLIRGRNLKPLPGRYIEVIQMDGLYSGANRVTGAFSVAVKGYVWENGHRAMTFGNVTLSGNLQELLKNVDVVGTDLEISTDKSFFSVPLIFKEISIAGA